MTPILHYKRGFFSRTSNLFSGESPVGFLTESAWKRMSEGELYGKKFRFVTRGFFKPETQITETDSGIVAGTITYNAWKNTARITFDGRMYDMKYLNFWHTKWAISDARGNRVRFHGNSSRGRIEVMDAEEWMVLAGIFTFSYFQRASAAASSSAMA
jgi:hypothetical protein